MSDKRQPIILSLDDDPQVLRSLRSDLRRQYRKEYRIISSESADDALEAVAELKKKGETIALFLSDQRMPEMAGVEFLEQARKIYPSAKRVLLTAYSDTDAAIKAINDVSLDYYLLKPWDPPEQKLYPVIDELLDDWQLSYRPEWKGISVIGYPYSPKSHDLKDWLAGNLVPYRWVEAESEQAIELMELHGCAQDKLPLVILEDGNTLSDPRIDALAERTGLSAHAHEELYDVVIVGAGPAGLAAAVYGGSEGLKTLVIEKRAPGGQAGTSSRIENYLGFPSGLSGAELSRRAVAQTLRFGVEMVTPREVTGIEMKGSYKILTLDDGSQLTTRAVILTTGVQYRRLPAEGADDFTGAGVYYGAAMTEANACRGQRVFIVGGGNSAGQGAVYLSKFAKEVNILVRKPDLSSSMSSYLIDQINGIDNINVVGRREITKVCGEEGRLRRLVVHNLEDDSSQEEQADALFIFIGARPRTDWLASEAIMVDDRGFIITGRELLATSERRKSWREDRNPFLLETCQPGVFAAGDVRSGAMNRVASAVGEGAMAIKFVHEYLAQV